MESDQLRLLLLGLGVLLVLGIYAWDRVKRRKRPVSHARRKASSRVAPKFSAEDPTPPDIAIDTYTEDDPDVAGSPRRDAPEEDAAERDEMPEFSAGEKAPDDVPSKIILVNIVTRNGEFDGESIARAAQEVELKLGDMNIYHRHDAENPRKVLFSMASMVEPGSFPADKMAEFSTAGLTLFAQLPAPRDGIAIYSDMLFTGERLAVMLGGEMQDERHNILTKQWIEHTRVGILEHRRQVQLARSRV